MSDLNKQIDGKLPRVVRHTAAAYIMFCFIIVCVYPLNISTVMVIAILGLGVVTAVKMYLESGDV